MTGHGIGRRAAGERGLSTVEVVFIAPLIMLFILVLVSLGQTVSGRSAVYGAARDAARAASLERGVGAAMDAARDVVGEQLEDVCADDPVVTQVDDADGRGFARGELFTIEVSCRVRGLDLVGVGLETTMTGRSSSPVDELRRIDE
ncbi:TadE/TadG family type IV pilus assembly protein [Streptomyces sp. 4N509B]|uniref:TadE/TadG family type IV pilus assembly protein n=1 Tax=Streptomyces sp. 4N509B TaxID=3457413 RepID=UPI003FD6A1F1